VLPAAQNGGTVGTVPFFANYPGAGANGGPGEIVEVGNSGRNILTLPGLFNLDMTLRKDTAIPKLGESAKLEFRFELFNVLNHTRLGTPGTALFNNVGVPTATAGVISNARGNSRQIQLALRLQF
jgi:hypothetical protein